MPFSNNQKLINIFCSLSLSLAKNKFPRIYYYTTIIPYIYADTLSSNKQLQFFAFCNRKQSTWLNAIISKNIHIMNSLLLILLLTVSYFLKTVKNQELCTPLDLNATNNWADCRYCKDNEKLNCRSWIPNYKFPPFTINDNIQYLKEVRLLFLWGGCPTKWNADKMNDYFPLLQSVHFEAAYCYNVCSPELVIGNRRIGFVGSRICPSVHTITPATLGTQVCVFFFVLFFVLCASYTLPFIFYQNSVSHKYLAYTYLQNRMSHLNTNRFLSLSLSLSLSLCLYISLCFSLQSF